MESRILPGKVRKTAHATTFLVYYTDGRMDAIVQCRSDGLGLIYRVAKTWVVPKEVLDCVLDSVLGNVPQDYDDVVYYVRGQSLELFYFRGTGRVFAVTVVGRVVDLGGIHNALEVARQLGLSEVEEFLKAVEL